MEEASYLEELGKVRDEQKEAEDKLAKCHEEKRRLEEEEDNYWREYCTYKCQKLALENENRR